MSATRFGRGNGHGEISSGKKWSKRKKELKETAESMEGADEICCESRSDLGTLEVRVEPGAREMVQAVRALLLATHWHQFTVLADYSASSVLLHRDLAELLLADISRSTRGVVLLICDLYAAKRVSAEAKRLNMMDGHFVWLWIDTCPNNTPLLSNTTKESDAVDQTNNSPKTPINHEPVNSVKVSKNITDSIRKYKRDLLGNDTIVNVTSFQRISSIKHFENNNKRDRTKNPKDFLQSDSNTSLLLQQLNRGFVISGAEGGGRVLLSNTSRLSLRLKSSPRDVENSNAQRESKLEGKNSKYLFLSNSSGPPALDFEPVGATKGGGGRVAYLKDSRVNFDLSSFSRPDVRRDPDLEWSPQETSEETTMTDSLPVGLLAIRPRPMKIDRHTVKGAVRLLADTIKQVLTQCADWMPQPGEGNYETSCWINSSVAYRNFSKLFVRELRTLVSKVLGGLKSSDKSLIAVFDILNLVPEKNTDYDGPSYASEPTQGNSSPPSNMYCLNERRSMVSGGEGNLTWRPVGDISGRSVHLDTIVWPGGDLVVAGLSSRAKSVFRIVTALAPPFVMEGELDEDGQCLRGVPCHRVLTSDKDNLTLVFNEMDTQERLNDEEHDDPEDDDGTEARAEDVDSRRFTFLEKIPATGMFELPNQPQKYKYRTNCCYGLTMDLLENVAQELEFDFHLYVVSDGAFGTRTRTENGTEWNGIVGDLVSGAAHMAFAAFSVSSARSEVIDYSVPYFFSGVSFLAAPTQKSEVPLLAFLLPFSPELWIAIFTSLNITAMAVAVYEWLSPFGLNPWGRQRSKNFSIASALWVMWGLLCGHLVAFKAPKSWPNKFLINVWGGFSVIFVASYTANIAALIAGLFFHNAVGNYHDRSLLSQRVGAPRASAADYYVHKANKHLWEHMQRFMVRDVEEGIQLLNPSQSPGHAPRLDSVSPPQSPGHAPRLDSVISVNPPQSPGHAPRLDFVSPLQSPSHVPRLDSFSSSQSPGHVPRLDYFSPPQSLGHVPRLDSVNPPQSPDHAPRLDTFSPLQSPGHTPRLDSVNPPQSPGHAPRLDTFSPLQSPGHAPDSIRWNDTLDILIADTPILDYYRATDHGCKLQKIGDAINEDTYAVGMAKGFPLKDSISAVIAKYSSNGYMDILQEKWYGALPCFKLATDIAQPRPLGVASVAGVFLLLGLGMVLGCLILLFEHLFYRYTLPILRHQPKGTIWRSRNIMFFSQKLYRFINCVELVSPHHAARELVHTIRQGQITSLFQKSVKRKEHEQRRRRKSKAQFFEMIQEIRRVQKEEKDQPPEEPKHVQKKRRSLLSPSLLPARSSPRKTGKSLFSPNSRRRFSTDMYITPFRSHLECPSNAVGRRLSKGSSLCNSPPDINSRLSSRMDVRSTSISNVSSSKSDKTRLLDAGYIQEMTIGARLSAFSSRPESLSTSDVSSRRKAGGLPDRSRSKSPIPSLANISTSQAEVKPGRSHKFRERIVSEVNTKPTMKSLPRLRTLSPEGTEIATVFPRSDLNSASYRSKSLEIQQSCSHEDEILPAEKPKPKRAEFKPYESIVEVNVSCSDAAPQASTSEKAGTSSKPGKKPHLLKRRQSHQQRLETAYSSLHTSPNSSINNGRDLLVPMQRHDNPRSPTWRRHKSQPVRSTSETVSPTSSSIPDVSSQPSPRTLEDFDEVFDDAIPPAPPPPSCNPKHPSPNGSKDSPLERLNREELVELWRSSESELRSLLLRAIQTKEVTDPP
uniref:Glutamate receptor n=2 Tax=Timema TaxID=61471 RepID=A0A7R9JUS3_TIMGE|nr:unnamed protein product [Timema genevievae]